MKTPQRGDAVIYIQGGRDYNALVLAAHSLNDSHLGEDGQPQLHLAVVFDEPMDTNTRKPKAVPLGAIPQTTTVHDVVHASHEFSDEYMKSHFLREVKPGDPHFVSAKAEILSRRGTGEWREVDPVGRETFPVNFVNEADRKSLPLSATPNEITGEADDDNSGNQ